MARFPSTRERRRQGKQTIPTTMKNSDPTSFQMIHKLLWVFTTLHLANDGWRLLFSTLTWTSMIALQGLFLNGQLFIYSSKNEARCEWTDRKYCSLFWKTAKISNIYSAYKSTHEWEILSHSSLRYIHNQPKFAEAVKTLSATDSPTVHLSVSPSSLL